jgi:transposase
LSIAGHEPYSTRIGYKGKSYKKLSKEDIVNIFAIGLDTLNRWIRKYKKIGSVEPEKQTKFREIKFRD